MSPHMLCHTFTTEALRAGADLETLRRIGGWRDYKMLAVYAHLMADDLKERHRAFSPLDRLRVVVRHARRARVRLKE